jgi:hypothetical protein
LRRTLTALALGVAAVVASPGPTAPAAASAGGPAVAVCRPCVDVVLTGALAASGRLVGPLGWVG